eukprot:Opistho-2@80166
MTDFDRKRRHVQEWLANADGSAPEEAPEMDDGEIEGPRPPKGQPPSSRHNRLPAKPAQTLPEVQRTAAYTKGGRPQPPPLDSKRIGARPTRRLAGQTVGEVSVYNPRLSEPADADCDDDEGLDLMRDIEEETQIISALKEQLRLQRLLLEQEYTLQQQSQGTDAPPVGGYANDGPSPVNGGRDSALGSLSASSNRSGSRSGSRR